MKRITAKLHRPPQFSKRRAARCIKKSRNKVNENATRLSFCPRRKNAPPGIKKARKFRALQNVLTHTSYERGANLLFDLADRAFERDGEFLHDKPNAGVKKTPLAAAQILDVFEVLQLAHDVGDILQTAGRKLVVENALTLRPWHGLGGGRRLFERGNDASSFLRRNDLTQRAFLGFFGRNGGWPKGQSSYWHTAWRQRT